MRQAQVKELVTPRYAGETIKIVVARGEERLSRDLTLVAALEPYAHPFLGFLPMRDAPTSERPLVGARCLSRKSCGEGRHESGRCGHGVR